MTRDVSRFVHKEFFLYCIVDCRSRVFFFIYLRGQLKIIFWISEGQQFIYIMKKYN